MEIENNRPSHISDRHVPDLDHSLDAWWSVLHIYLDYLFDPQWPVQQSHFNQFSAWLDDLRCGATSLLTASDIICWSFLPRCRLFTPEPGLLPLDDNQCVNRPNYDADDWLGSERFPQSTESLSSHTRLWRQVDTHKSACQYLVLRRFNHICPKCESLCPSYTHLHYIWHRAHCILPKWVRSGSFR